MSLNPFEAVKDYATMPSRIAWGTFVSALGCILLLKNQVPTIASFLSRWAFEVKVFDVGIPIGLALSAGAIAFLSRIFKWHDLLSDILGIRNRFDVGHILLPLAAGASRPVRDDQLSLFRQNRHALMRGCFYRYASSTKPELDPHTIILALDNWSWYWILLEAISLLIPTALLLFAFGRCPPAFAVLAGVLAIAGVMFLIYRQAEHYARLQVQEILSVTGRATAIASECDAVLGAR